MGKWWLPMASLVFFRLISGYYPITLVYYLFSSFACRSSFITTLTLYRKYPFLSTYISSFFTYFLSSSSLYIFNVTSEPSSYDYILAWILLYIQYSLFSSSPSPTRYSSSSSFTWCSPFTWYSSSSSFTWCSPFTWYSSSSSFTWCRWCCDELGLVCCSC